MTTFLSSALSGIVVAILTVMIAGRRLQSETIAAERGRSRDALRNMAAEWSVAVRTFIEGLADLEITRNDSEVEKYRLCSAVIEEARRLPFLERRALHIICSSLFGKQALKLAIDLPAKSLLNGSPFQFDDAMFARAKPKPGQEHVREIEIGLFGILFDNRQYALDHGIVTIYDTPRIPAEYRPTELLRQLGILTHLTWFTAMQLEFENLGVKYKVWWARRREAADK